jgi:hypothetical protein
MLTKNSVDASASIRVVEDSDDFAETRLEASGYVFHGSLAPADGKRMAVKAGSNLLHFARCAKLEKGSGDSHIVWFRTITLANSYLNENVGASRWKWCKICQREITQKLINEH